VRNRKKAFLHTLWWIVATLIYIPCAGWGIITVMDRTAGTDSIEQRFASGKPAKVYLGRQNSARALFVRADSPGTPECVTNRPDGRLERKAGHDLTVDGTTWRRIYAVSSSRSTSAEFLVTCRAGKGAEFALGRDRYWEGVLLGALSLVVYVLLGVGAESLYGKRKRAADPEDTVAEVERRASSSDAYVVRRDS
jgi:hypothetical protein